MLNAFVPSGTHDDIADILLDRYKGISATINFPMPDNPDDDQAVSKIIAKLQLQ
jgi:hypothetical protein